MEHRNIGSLNVSLVGVGCNNFGWRIDASATQGVVDAAIDRGINFFDTADFYGTGQSEEFLSQALDGRRRSVVIATKFGLPMGDHKQGAKPSYVKEACEASLRRLRTDYIDLYQLHRPDAETPLEDTLGALNDLVEAGKVREIGCSNFGVDLLQESEAASKPGAARWRSIQNHYNLLHREPELGVLKESARLGISFLPYYPLESGLLSGKYLQGALPASSRGTDGWGLKMLTRQNLTRASALDSFARSAGHTLLELAFSWLAMKQEIASVIAGAKTPEQVAANASAPVWKLSSDELAKVDKLLS